MTSRDGWRRSPRPPGWKHKIRPRILRRDGHRCTWTLEDGTRCPWTDHTGSTLEVDHAGDHDDHRDHMLRTLCGRGSPDNHHGTRTSRQAIAARPSRRRPPEGPHPGVLPR
jgi:5-methylcytosine-specific restriction enzyme A